jgi:hypothetical protein
MFSVESSHICAQGRHCDHVLTGDCGPVCRWQPVTNLMFWYSVKNAVCWNVMPYIADFSTLKIVIASTTMCYIQEYGILHRHRREIPKILHSINNWALWQRRNVFPVRYELGFYIREDGTLQISYAAMWIDGGNPKLLHCYFLCIGNWGLTDVAMSSCLL